MEKSYHINGKGEVRRCNASVRACRYGAQTHYGSFREALAANEAALADEYGAAKPGKPRELSLEELHATLRALPARARYRPEAGTPAAETLKEELLKELLAVQASGRRLFLGRPRGQVTGEQVVITFVDSEENDRVLIIQRDRLELHYRAGSEMEPQDFGLKYSLPLQTKKLTPAELSASSLVRTMLTLQAQEEQINWDEDERAVTTSYVEAGHGEINSALRRGEELGATTALLDSAIDRTRLQEDTKVYRGLRLNEEELKQLRAGTYRDAAYLSTSRDPRTALSFAGKKAGAVLLELTLPKGTPYLEGSSQEQEIILARNFKLERHRVFEVPESFEA